MTYVSETHHFQSTVGNTQSGITICYDGGCLAGPTVLLVSMTYMAYGTSANCCWLEVVPHPAAETVEEMDCSFVSRAAYVRNLRISTGVGCGCGETHLFAGTPAGFGCSPLSAEQTTWGRIKAFYRE